MDATLAHVVMAVCRLPLDFTRGDVSEHHLLRRSGYRKARHAVTTELLSDCFRQHPDLAEAWIVYSESNRGFPAWYVTERDPGVWEVGLIGRRGDADRVQQFDDRALACATYLKARLEHWAGSRLSWLL